MSQQTQQQGWTGVSFRQAGVTRVDLEKNRHTLLEPTTLDITEDLVVVLGPNGSGKTTLLRLLNGLTTPTTGEVTINGEPVSRMRARTGFLFADPAAQLLMPTVAEDVALSLRGLPDGAQSWAARWKKLFTASATETEVPEEVAEILAQLGLSDLAQRSIYQLSSGQRQLVAAAAILVRRPDLLIADEPTTLLDLANTRILTRIFRQALAQGLIKQCLFATHDLHLARIAQRALVIFAGAVCFDGPVEEAIHYYTQRVAAEDGGEYGSY